jgi:hypothetical protein
LVENLRAANRPVEILENETLCRHAAIQISRCHQGYGYTRAVETVSAEKYTSEKMIRLA